LNERRAASDWETHTVYTVARSGPEKYWKGGLFKAPDAVYLFLLDVACCAQEYEVDVRRYVIIVYLNLS
jgi:hypothetical protein